MYSGLDNPHLPYLMEGSIANGVLAPTMTEWGLPGEPWTFVVGVDGPVQARFEAFTTR